MYRLIIFIILFSWAFGHPIHAQQMHFILNDSTGVPEIVLDEITIRAPKERIELKSLTGAATVLTARTLKENRIESIKDISAITPNLFMPDYGSKLTSPVYIRGIGSRINSPSVGLYVDQIPYFEKSAFDFDFFDIERVEVLRGPQGSLYGRNSMGGIINIITRAPGEKPETSFRLSAATYGEYAAGLSHYNKISKDLGYSLSFNYRHTDGFFTNTYNNEQVDYMDALGMRNRLSWQINERWQLSNILSYEYSKQGGYPYAVYNDSLEKAELINYNQPSGYERNLLSNGLILNYKGPRIEMISTTSYQALVDFQEIDQDFTADSLYLVTQKQQQHMLSQEFVFKSAYAGNYQWVAGVFGFTQLLDKSVDVDVYAQKLRMFKSYDEINSGFALFHQSMLDNFLINGLTLTAGIRIDFEQSKLSYTYDMLRNGQNNSIADTTYPLLNYNEVSPKIALSYALTNQTSVYALAAKGFKTGGFNSTFERPEDLTFLPEQSWNYELGIKTSLFEQRTFAELSLFYIDWTNQQIYQTVPSGRGSMLKNAGHSLSKGFEVSVKSSLPLNFEVFVAYGYTHASFLSHIVDSTKNYNGNFLPYVPRHTLALQLNKTIKVNTRFIDRIRITGLWKSTGELFWNEQNNFSQQAYNLIDLNIAFTKNNFEIRLFGENIFGEEYTSFYFEALGNRYMQSGKPAQFGIDLSLKI
ncbi:MAG: TonB-dependent receptor [Bacteroidetes bacterium]|nr:TonB-dependent receptor [Bacteroidota bacterium]